MSNPVQSNVAASAGRVLRGGVTAVVARKELLELLRDRRVAWTAGVLILLMLGAFLMGWQQMQRTQAERTGAQNVSYHQWLGQGEKNPHSAAHFGQYAFKPSSPLSFIDPGITPFVGVSVWMEAHKQNEFKFRPARDATSLQRFGELSVAFILQVLVPLVIILLTFSAFTGERERGTLRQLLSVGIQPWQLLAGKALASAVGLCLLVLPLAVGSLVMMLPLSGHDAGIDGVPERAFLMIAGYAIYHAGFAALALGVSALAKSSRKALVILLAFWAVNSFIVPRLMIDFARSVRPTPTAVEFQGALTEARKATFGHDDTHPAYLHFRDEVLKQYGVSKVEELPVDFDGLALREDDARGYRIFDSAYGALWSSYATQERIRALAGFVFPLMAIQPISMGLAGTDTEHHNDFARAAETYRRLIQDITGDDLIRNRKYGDKEYKAAPELWAKIPAFEYQIPATRGVWARQDFNFLILTTWALAMGIIAVFSARRLSPV
jgi:ABC-2 type transport system permease protein